MVRGAVGGPRRYTCFWSCWAGCWCCCWALGPWSLLSQLEGRLGEDWSVLLGLLVLGSLLDAMLAILEALVGESLRPRNWRACGAPRSGS